MSSLETVVIEQNDVSEGHPGLDGVFDPLGFASRALAKLRAYGLPNVISAVEAVPSPKPDNVILIAKARPQEPPETQQGEQKRFKISAEQALTLTNVIFDNAPDIFLLSSPYSLALHNQELLEHVAALEAHLQGKIDTPVPRYGAFHHPDMIRNNASQIFNSNQGFGHAWSVIFATLAHHNLELLEYIGKLEEQTGIISRFDRINRKKHWADEEDKRVLGVSGQQAINDLAAELGIDPMRIRTRKSVLASSNLEKIT